jgi:hypothetical protein
MNKLVKNCKSILVVFVFSLVSSLFAQSKVETNTIRLKGGGFYGASKTDLEKRNQLSNLFGGEFEGNWRSPSGYAGANFGLEYFHVLGTGLLSNMFIGVNSSLFNRNYNWNSFYPVGIGLKEGTNQLGILDPNIGVTLAVAPNLRILPKAAMRYVGQDFTGNYLGIGTPSYFGNQNSRNSSSVGMVGSGLEYDLTQKLTIFGDFLVSAGQGFRGHYDSRTIILSNSGYSYSQTNGDYKMSSTRVAGGLNYQLFPRLRLFGMVNEERMNVKVANPSNFVITNNNFDLLGTFYQYIVAKREEHISVTGVTVGVTYDIGLEI